MFLKPNGKIDSHVICTVFYAHCLVWPVPLPEAQSYKSFSCRSVYQWRFSFVIFESTALAPASPAHVRPCRLLLTSQTSRVISLLSRPDWIDCTNALSCFITTAAVSRAPSTSSKCWPIKPHLNWWMSSQLMRPVWCRYEVMLQKRCVNSAAWSTEHRWMLCSILLTQGPNLKSLLFHLTSYAICQWNYWRSDQSLCSFLSRRLAVCQTMTAWRGCSGTADQLLFREML